MSEDKKKGKAPKIITVITVILIIVLVGVSAYLLTAPHTAAEALLAKPIAGQNANYAAKGTVTVEAEAASMGLPKAEIPFELKVSNNRTRITLFPDEGSSVYELYITEEDGKIACYDTGDASLLSAPVLNVGTLLLGEDGSMKDALDLPDIIGSQPDAASLATFVGEASLEKTDDSDIVHIDGTSISKLLASMDEQSEGELKGTLGDLLDGSNISIVYNKDRTPQTAKFEGGEITTDIDAGFFGTVNVKVDVSGDMTFEQFGEVSADETQVPQGATKR